MAVLLICPVWPLERVIMSGTSIIAQIFVPLRASSSEFCIIAYASSECPDEPLHSQSIITAFAAWTERKKRCRWRCRPNFVPSKAVVLLLLIHSLMFLPLVCRGSVFGPRFVMHYLEFFLVLQSSRWETESKMPHFTVFLLLVFCGCSSRCHGLVWSM